MSEAVAANAIGEDKAFRSKRFAVARALLWLGQGLEIWLWADEKQLDQVLADPNWAPSANTPEEGEDAS